MIFSFRSGPTRVAVLLALASAAATSAGAQEPPQQQPPPPQTRARVGVAFGGGSARGIAHVGVIQWFEEHHIPIDVAAGTSMGGLIGGAFAAGMSAAELRTLIETTDWDVMFGSSSFPFKNVRRKEDARSYPSRLEFGLRRGLVPPTSLNDGQQVDLLLARIAGGYSQLERFDDLPTPFRTVAVDLRTAERIVMDNGSLATAMRATMSLPGIFPPVESEGRVLVDGGALDNVPADVVREMGARTVIAVDVGYVAKGEVDYSLFGLMGQTVDSMMRANTRRALQAADLIIAVDVEEFGSLDWRRGAQLVERGYQAAEKHRDALLAFRASDDEWQAWLSAREQRRRKTSAAPMSLSTAGIAPADVAVVRRTLERHVGQTLDIPALEHDLATLSGLDRYQGVAWRLIGPPGNEALLVTARPKPYAPPFMMLGLSLENTTSNDFRARFGGRYLAFDVLGSGAELRIDAAIGSDPSAAFSWYRPLFKTRVFTRLSGIVDQNTIDYVVDDVVIAQYRIRRELGGADLGLNISPIAELTVGLRTGHVNASVRAGDPGLPEVGGLETRVVAQFRHDGHDSPVLPSKGTAAVVDLTHFLKSPSSDLAERTNEGVTQLEAGMATFWKWRRMNRLFVVASAGTSFDGSPISQFSLGHVFQLDAFRVGERRGDHYGVVTVGAARQVGRMPDFMGGGIFIAGWLQNGAAFLDEEDADFNTHLAAAVVIDSLVGPVAVGASAGLDGGWRTFITIGRLFR